MVIISLLTADGLPALNKTRTGGLMVVVEEVLNMLYNIFYILRQAHSA
jgi:hypothetical protein